MQTVRIDDGSGDWLIRDQFVMAWFCAGPFPNLVPGIRNIFDSWLLSLPKETLAHTMIGTTASQPKKFGPKTLAQCYDILDVSKAKKRPVSMFSLGGPQEFNSDHWFTVVGDLNPVLSDYVTRSSLVEIRTSTEFVNTIGIQAYADFAQAMAAELPFTSGYASPALTVIAESLLYEASPQLIPLAFRHPGYDIHNNCWTRSSIRNRSVGARWMTFLSSELAESIGGVKDIQKQLPKATITECGTGISIRLGDNPEIGDTNRRGGTPELSKLAKLLVPITYFKSTGLSSSFGGDDERRDEWEQRFFQ